MRLRMTIFSSLELGEKLMYFMKAATSCQMAEVPLDRQKCLDVHIRSGIDVFVFDLASRCSWFTR